MTFRLSRVVRGNRVTFQFSGELTRMELAEIDATVALDQDGPVAFDLAELTTASREGIEYLRQAAARGTQMVNRPAYIGRWIETAE